MAKTLTAEEIASLELHEVTAIFPAMEDEDLAELQADIQANGLLERIWVWDGRIIDGRNRWIACRNIGYELGPEHFRTWDGKGGLLGIVRSLNRTRRHLTPGQKAAIGAELEPLIAREIEEAKKEKCSEAGKAGGEKAGRGRPSGDRGGATSCATLFRSNRRDAHKEAAKAAGSSPPSVSAAKKIKEASPETFEEVKRGEKSLYQAKKELGLTPNPSGKCRVNGVLCDDTPEVAEQRRKGRIPADVVVDVTEPETPTTVEAIAEDHAERAAIQDDLNNDDWFARLPLAPVLKDQQLAVFREDALLFRALEAARKTFAYHASRAINKTRRDGAFKWKVQSFLGVEPPDRWKRCCERAEGGCAGEGFKSFGGEQRPCGKCHGRGYWLI